jgi:hypothetical protein
VARSLHNGLPCSICHGGSDEAVGKEAAHEGVIRNPTDLAVVGDTCGLCHEDHVARVRKSLHATMAGIISSTRYAFAARREKDAPEATFAVEDADGDVPVARGAVRRLEQLPAFAESGNPGDDYLRNQCLRCHLWTEGARRAGDYRASGCAACHVLYADDGLSRGDDPTIAAGDPGHPIRHELTSRIPSEQCNHCHNRGGRTGVSFVGTMEADPYGTPFTDEGGAPPRLHGKHYNRLRADVHHERGLSCIDCHTSSDLHGDGNIYVKKEHAVEIRCRSCHGDVGSSPTGRTVGGEPLPHLEWQGERLVMTSKITGGRLDVPNVNARAAAGQLHPSMLIAGHRQKLECYACHARWAPQCYGCDTKMDMRQKGVDWITGGEDAYQWQESRSYLRWETPALGINHRGKVSPFIPGCQVILTQIDEAGEVVKDNFTFTTADGHSGLMHNQIQPHTISRESRTCVDCHATRKALGLGGGFYDPRRNGLPLDFELERIVDEEGRQIQATAHVGSRPFNKEELQRISRVGACLACHGETDAAFWQKVRSEAGAATTDEAHSRLIERFFRLGVQ